MPIAAVPEYLGQDFSKASPGLRFGMYLPIWGTDQRSNGALQQACALSADDKRISKALCQRQAQLFNHTPTAQGLRLYATAVAPFTTGLGIEHPLENGFAFLNPYGLPYLPGSGVKGVLRQAALDLAGGAWETSDWSLDQRHIILDRAGKRLFDASDIDVLFGREPQEGDTQHLRGVLSFWDVIPGSRPKS